MKKSLIIILLLILSSYLKCQSAGELKLLIRGDDIGSSHTANVACIESYKNGIMRSVELMVPGPCSEVKKAISEIGIKLVSYKESGSSMQPVVK